METVRGILPSRAWIGHHMHHIASASFGRLRAFVLGIALLALFAPCGIAEARQVVQSICTATETRGFDPAKSASWFGEWPATDAIVRDEVQQFEEACGPVFARGSLAWTSSSFDYAFESSVGGFTEFDFILQAGGEGAALRVAPGTAAYLVRKGDFEFLPAGGLIEMEPFGEIECFAVGRCSLVVESGEIAAAIGVYGYWEAWVVGAEWSCNGTRAWGIGSAELDCEGVDDPSACNPSGGSFGIGSDADTISAGLSAGPWPSAMTIRCEFLLETASCVRYRQNGGSYCDTLPTIDGATLPLPPIPFAPCFDHAGAVLLTAGWHVLEVFAADLGDGSFTLDFTPGDCGPDCNGNGRPDFVDIEWAAKYEGLDLDFDLDGTLDSCERAEGDLDLDGWIGPVDLALLLADWGSFGVGDVDGDGTVGAADLLILLARWRVPE
ncbi:MAG: hypothetical protein RI967_776 [Planctomycetota bacterium]